MLLYGYLLNFVPEENPVNAISILFNQKFYEIFCKQIF